MTRIDLRRMVLACALAFAFLPSLPANAAGECFMSSKIYRIHPLHGGGDVRDGWTVKADAFNQCVHRAEAADKTLRGRYPDTVYELSLAATIGCHSPCDG
jgi:hypothetical protein